MKYNISSPAVVAAWKAGFPAPETLQSTLKQFDAEDVRAAEAADYRMKNYYDCVDDYSWGGICDRAAAQARAERDMVRATIKEILSGEVPTETVSTYYLVDLNGNFVTDSVVDTKFGRAFIIRGPGGSAKFVNIAKKPETYEKKGYRLMRASFTYQYYYRVNRMGEWYAKAIITGLETAPVAVGESFYVSKMSKTLWMAMMEEERVATTA